MKCKNKQCKEQATYSNEGYCERCCNFQRKVMQMTLSNERFDELERELTK